MDTSEVNKEEIQGAAVPKPQDVQDAEDLLQDDPDFVMPPSVRKQMTKQDARSRSILMLNDYMTQDLNLSDSVTEDATSPTKIEEKTKF